MNLLAIDTASTSGSIALYKKDKIIFSQYTDIHTTHSERLMPMIKSAFDLMDMTPADLTAVLIANGPGSFTGIRIGLATAKGICMGHEIPLIPFNNLLMLAANCYQSQYPVLSVIDARMNEVYSALYSPELEEIIPPMNTDLSSLISLLHHREILLVGDHLPSLEAVLQENGIRVHHPLKHQNTLQAQALIGLFLNQNNTPTWDFEEISALEPYYLRSSQAQINHNRQEKK